MKLKNKLKGELKIEKESYFEYLDDLRESGVVNMYGAVPYLMNDFLLGQEEASNILNEWMRTFSERHPG